jgi:hypothetical protein
MTAYPTTRFSCAFLLAFALAACGEPVTPADTGTTPDAATADDAFAPIGADAFTPIEPDAFVPSDPDAGPATVLFSRDVAPILEANCRGSGCHTSPQTFFLGGGSGCPMAPERRFVVPFDPESSFVVVKIEGRQSAGCGQRMPRGRAPLSSENITTIRTWIAEGARDN